MRFGLLVLVGMLLVGCSKEPPAAPKLDARAVRVQQIEGMLKKVAASQGMAFHAGCYPERFITAYDLSRVIYMANTAVDMEQEGWEIACVSFGNTDDSYGAVNPQSGVVFQCPIGDGPVIVMHRGSVEDGSAECIVVQ